MRLLDTRFAGVARGVGTARILGRVHSAQIKIANLHLPCAFTVMEGREVDLLFGLDMLKAHQACIDLAKNALIIQGQEVPFLPEHKLPDKARDPTMPVGEPGSALSTRPTTLGGAPALPGPARSGGGSGSGSGSGGPVFPGSGNTLGRAAMSSNPPQPREGTRPSRSTYPESDISTLMGLGVTREAAINALNAADGNMDVAASFLF